MIGCGYCWWDLQFMVAMLPDVTDYRLAYTSFRLPVFIRYLNTSTSMISRPGNHLSLQLSDVNIHFYADVFEIVILCCIFMIL